MIYEHIQTNRTHINTVLQNNKIYFKNLTSDAVAIMQYRFKLKNTNVIKLSNLWIEKYYGDDDRKLGSIVVDWGDGKVTNVFTEYVNTGTYNTNSNVVIDHTYELPLNEMIEITIMSDAETLIPIPFDNSVDGIEIFEFGGVMADTHKAVTTKTKLSIYQRKDIGMKWYTIKGPLEPEGTFFRNYSHRELSAMFRDTALSEIPEDIFTGRSELRVLKEFFMNGESKTNFTVPENLFKPMTSLMNIENLFRDVNITINRCSDNTSIFSECPLYVVSRAFSTSYTNRIGDPKIFEGKRVQDLNGTFAGCGKSTNIFGAIDLTNVQIEDHGGDSPFLLTFSDSLKVVISSEKLEPLKAFDSFNSTFLFSAEDGNFDPNLLEGFTLRNAFRTFELPSAINMNSFKFKLRNDLITLGSINSATPKPVNIAKIFKNRLFEIGRNPFILKDNISEINYTDCFVNSMSIYSDKQIFKEFWNPNISSGITPITARVHYTIVTPDGDANINLKFTSPYNGVNQIEPETYAAITITQTTNGMTRRYELNEEQIRNLTSTGGVYTLNTPRRAGTHTISVDYHHCAPLTLVENPSDPYDINEADIELFPTDISYVGYKGLNLFTAKVVTGDFFKLFRENLSNHKDQKLVTDSWMNGIMKGITSNVTSIHDGIFRNAFNVGTFTILENLFNDDIADNPDFYNVNPFTLFTKRLLAHFSQIKTVRTWFPPSINGSFKDITVDWANDMFWNYRSLTNIDRVFQGCSIYATNENQKVKFTNNPIVSVTKWIGKTNYLAFDLLGKPTLEKVNRFHETPMDEGMSTADFGDFFMNFENIPANKNVDLTEMFYGEHFEIPDNFIRNVTGTLKYNNCFKGSYKIGASTDEVVFQNVANKEPNNVTGLWLIPISTPLKVTFKGYGSDPLRLSMSEKDGIPGENNKLIRIVQTNASGNRTILTKYIENNSEDYVLEPKLFNPPVTNLYMEIYSPKSNPIINEVSGFSGGLAIDTMEGCFASSKWSPIRLSNKFPGLLVHKIKCVNAGGPWRNVKPDANGDVDFSSMFTGSPSSADGALIDRKIFKMSTRPLKINLTDTFSKSSFGDFNLGVLYELKDSTLNGTYMFRENSNENFNFVQLTLGSFAFMEILFKQFSVARGMFIHATTPKTLFNNAPYFGCSSSGSIIPVNEQKLLDISSFCSLYLDTDSSKQQTTEEFLPYFNPQCELKCRNWLDFCLNTAYKLNPIWDYSNHPKTGTDIRTSLWAYPGSVIPNKITVDSFNIFNTEVVGHFKSSNLTIEFNNLYHIIRRDPEYTTNKVHLTLFCDASKNIYRKNKYLVEPIGDNFKNTVISFNTNGVSNRGFRTFTSFAPDYILFRNCKGIEGSSSITQAIYPSHVSYHNTLLNSDSVDSIVFIRENQVESARVPTYLTLHIHYADGSMDEQWHVVDDVTDECTITIDRSKIVGNTIPLIKVMSSVSFCLTDANITHVERLDGWFWKNVEPLDSGKFKFNKNYFYFIKSLGGTLFDDVLLEEGPMLKFASSKNVSLVENIDDGIFKNQGHIVNIDGLFKDCVNLDITPGLLTGLTGVTRAVETFSNTRINSTEGILSPIANVINLRGIFKNAHINSLSDYTLRGLPNTVTLESVFEGVTFTVGTKLTIEFMLNTHGTPTMSHDNMFRGAKGLVNKNLKVIEDQYLLLEENRTFVGMFADTGIIDVSTAIRHGCSTVDHMDPSRTVDMFKGCITYEDRVTFERVFGDRTGVIFKNSIGYSIEAPTNLTGNFVSLSPSSSDTDLIRVVTGEQNARTVRYRTVGELKTNTDITTDTTKVELFSNYPMLLENTSVTKLKGKLPGPSIDITNFKIGAKYPNITEIDVNFFSNLVDQTTIESMFKGLRDINIIPAGLFRTMTKLSNVSELFMDAGGTLNTFSFLFNSKKLTNVTNAYKNVNIGVIPENSVDFTGNETNIDVSGMFDGSNALVGKNAIKKDANLALHAVNFLRTCKSLYTPAEVITNFIADSPTSLETVKYFMPTLSATTDPLNLYVAHTTEIDTSKKLDFMVDWGDGSHNIFRNITSSSLASIEHTYTTASEKIIRIWSSYYTVVPKKKTENNTSTLITKAEGCLQRIGDDNQSGYFNINMPNCLSVGSTLLRGLPPDQKVFGRYFQNSGIRSISAEFFKLSFEPAELFFRPTFEGMFELNDLSPDVFKNITTGPLNKVDLVWTFALCYKCVVPENVFEPLRGKTLNTPTLEGLFREAHHTVVTPKMMEVPMLMATNGIHSINSSFRNTPTVDIFGIMSKFKVGGDLRDLTEGFYRCQNLELTSDYIIDVNQLAGVGGIMFNKFLYGAKLNGTNDIEMKVVKGRNENITLDITDSLKGFYSPFTEQELFDFNNTTGSSGVITRSRNSLKITTTAGTLNLIPYENAEYASKVIIKKNDILVGVYDYTPVGIEVADNDILEIFTTGDTKDAFMKVDVSLSTSKIKKLDGILNVGPKSITNGTINFTLSELFGTDVTEITDTFFTQFNIVTDATNLCKGLINLVNIPKGLLSPFTVNTKWNSFFENCSKLVLREGENSEMFVTANKGISFNYMFKNCSSLTRVPTKFFKGCVEPDKTFVGTFTGASITEPLPPDLDNF